MIWCASRISVRSISDADMMRVFSRSPGVALTFALLINALADDTRVKAFLPSEQARKTVALPVAESSLSRGEQADTEGAPNRGEEDNAQRGGSRIDQRVSRPAIRRQQEMNVRAPLSLSLGVGLHQR